MATKMVREDKWTLYPWQSYVLNEIEAHQEKRESEQYQGIADYSINRALGIVLAMPKRSGHSYLASLIACKFPTLLIYGKMSHYNELIRGFTFHTGTETLSTYEIFYALHKPDVHQPTPEFIDVRKRFEGKRVVVVDNALSVSDEIKNLVYGTSQGICIFLGH